MNDQEFLAEVRRILQSVGDERALKQELWSAAFRWTYPGATIEFPSSGAGGQSAVEWSFCGGGGDGGKASITD